MESEIKKIFRQSIERLDQSEMKSIGVMHWASPVLSFGNLITSSVATLGLNPSNKEFENNDAIELSGEKRRFHTLTSLGLRSWKDLQESHIELIFDSFDNYFQRNPYDTWFKSLDRLISGTSYSYYHKLFEACHLDLVPYATNPKWGELSSKNKSYLINYSQSMLGQLLKASSISLLVLNGQSVVNNFSNISNVKFKVLSPSQWRLHRINGNHVAGLSYSGLVTSIGGIGLGRSIRVLGYNHNIQSSYGVTNKVKASIQAWINDQVLEFNI